MIGDPNASFALWVVRPMVDIPSPCIGICRVEDGICVGCGRTVSEITDWLALSPYQQAAVVSQARSRLDERERLARAVR